MISNNRYDDALKLLELAVVDNPNFFEAYSTISEIYLNQEDKNKSKQNFEKILNIQSIPFAVKIQVFANYLGIFKNNLDEKELSNFIAFATQIINQNPTEAKTFVYLGDLNIKSKKPKEGRDAYLKAVTIDPSIFEAWLAVIELDAKLNLIDDLVMHSEKAIEFYPNQPFFWYHNGFGHKLKKNYNDAVVSFEEARNLSVQNNELKNHINAQLGDVYQELKKYDKSENAYEAVLKVNPNHEQTLNNYSYFLANRKKNLEKAAELAKRLVELYPKQPVYLDTQAWVTFNAGNYAKANEIIDKAIGLNASPSAGILEHKGDILFKLGQKEVALDFWRKALIQSPENKILERKTKEGNLIE
jgi:tetratricopeptide (TPR) repeat protein